MQNQLWTIQKLLTWTTDYFKLKHIESPRLDAEVLLAHVLGLKRIGLYLEFERPLTMHELEQFKAMIKRRIQQEPVSYIIGRKEFFSREFFVNRDVLIPRPETELVVETILSNLKMLEPESLRTCEQGNYKFSRSQAHALTSSSLLGFEFGLGSGNISITLLKEIPQLKMIAVENSDRAVWVAQKNAGTQGVADRLAICTAFEALPDKSFDFVVSNPPYVKTAELSLLPAGIKDFEPLSALDGGEDGFKYFGILAEFVSQRLGRPGFIVLETGESQAEAVKGIFKKACEIELNVQKDYAGHDRILWGYYG